MKSRVILCVSLVVLVACSRQNERLTTDIKQSAATGNTSLPRECQSIEALLMRCESVVLSDKEAKKVLAVLSEQLQTAPMAEQEKTCQEVHQFWQAACGVTQ